MPLSTRRRVPRSEYRLPVTSPYRLDLTAAVLRRFSTNAVDRIGVDGSYRRALLTPAGPLVVEVAQATPREIVVTAHGTAAARALAPSLAARMLGVHSNVTPFLRASRAIPWLDPLARRMRGVRPPRYPTLWEACVNAIVFQQVSLAAASAILRRLIEALSQPVPWKEDNLYAFIEPDSLLDADTAVLAKAGLSAAKIVALRAVAQSVADGTLNEPDLDALASPEAALALRQQRGIGPWTAAVILLRGLGRLDVFPENDSGAVRSFALLGGGQRVATDLGLELLGEQRGMLYYHLLLARLEARGELPPASRPPAR